MQDTKTQGSDSTLPLPEITWLALLDHQERQRIERDKASPGLDRSRTGFPSRLGTVRLHDLRRTMVTLLLELGVPRALSRRSLRTPTSTSL